MKTIINSNGYRLILFILPFIFSFCSEKKDDVQKVADFTGNYSGGWWSNPPTENNYVNIPASLRLTEVKNDTLWTGEFFFTRSFNSCCKSGSNDGKISMTIKDSVITKFVYNDIIPNCNGTFEGSGKIDSSGTIMINFTGSDCEGEHKGGKLEVKKK